MSDNLPLLRTLQMLRQQSSDLYGSFRARLTAPPGFREEDSEILRRYLCLDSITACEELAESPPRSVSCSCSLLHRIHARPACILIDEYDTPLARAWGQERHPLPGQDPRETDGYCRRRHD